MKRSYQKPRSKYWCDFCDRAIAEEGGRCKACGKRMRRKNNQKEPKETVD